MRQIKYLTYLLFAGIAIICLGYKPLEKSVADFRLKNVDGHYQALSDYKDAKGFIIVFTCNHCPFARLYPGRLNALYNKYRAAGVPLLAVNSVDTTVFDEDKWADMQVYAKENNVVYPYLYDPYQAVAKSFAASKTPHAFIIWKEQGAWIIKYKGAIDDNGAEPDKVTHKYIEEAVDALLEGKEVATKETASIGCRIKFRN
jgi:peroxiredoxin